MVMKIARFAENQNDILRKNQKKVNILLDYDNENPLMSAFIEDRKWYLIKRIHVRCQKGYIPSPESIRIDDGKYPIYVETTKDSLNIIGDADYIEWSGKQNQFFQSIKKAWKTSSLRTFLFLEGQLNVCSIETSL